MARAAGRAVPAPAERSEGEARPLYRHIYAVLREHLEEGRLPSGLVLGEAAVARAFGSSRIPAATALRRLRDDGLLADFDGRGYLAGGLAAAPVRRDLLEAGLVLPDGAAAELKLRNRRERIYPEVEHLVAASLPYGRFQLNESALAEHYGVSRTVAHEVLTRLERIGLATQDVNQRWYAGPLTPELMREHYELRWLLEPIALAQASAGLDPADLRRKHARLEKAAAGARTSRMLERLEHDLHVDTVLRCPNRQLREAIRRSQLPLIATHDTFQRHRDTSEIDTMIAEHLAIFAYLLAGRRPAAMRMLKQHLRRSLDPNIERLRNLGPLPEARRMPFLQQIG